MPRRPGPILVIALLLVFVVLHLGFAPDTIEPRAIGATMLGGVAFLLMTMSIVLSTRLRTIEAWFGGLDQIYRVHKIAGVVAGLLVLVHFVGVPKELPVGADPLANPLVPSAPMGMFALIVLVISLALALNRKIPYSRWRPVHKAMGLVYLLAIGHFMTAPAVFFERFSISGIMLILAAIIGMVAFLYSVFGLNRRTAVAYEIEAVNPLERATEIVLRPVGDALAHRPGQFASLQVEGKGWSEPHPFTISSAPGEDHLRFTVKVLGDWTRKVREELVAGGRAIVRGPYGHFDPAAAGNRQVWLAGGVGVTPFLSALRALDPDDPREITLVYAVREKAEALFLDELQAISHPGFKLVLLESNAGQFARVDIMKSKLGDPLASYDFFLCGPKPMVDGLRKGLRGEGVPRARIHTEAFEFR